MKKMPIAAALLAVLPLALPAVAAPAAQVFVAVKQPESIDAEWRAHLCALLPQPCDAKALTLHRPRGGAAGDYVVLSEAPLALGRLKRAADAADWKLDRVYDFTGYAGFVKEGEAGEVGNGEVRRALAPALYPLADGRWAVAVLQRQFESYSGGGASFSTADFVPLDADPASAKAAYEGIPFSCSKLIRACFSEKEYKTSKHCHDESSGSLRIAYSEPAKAGGPYGWQFTWLQSDWAAHVPASATVSTRSRFSGDGSGGGSADFCGGGPQ